MIYLQSMGWDVSRVKEEVAIQSMAISIYRPIIYSCCSSFKFKLTFGFSFSASAFPFPLPVSADLLCQQIHQLCALHIIERMHINAQGSGNCLNVQPKGGKQFQETHLLTGQGIGERGA